MSERIRGSYDDALYKSPYTLLYSLPSEVALASVVSDFTVTLSVFVEMSPVIQVTGLHWGDYIGSPDHPPPVITWSSDRKQTVVKLVALSTGEVFGLDPFSTLLVRETGKHQ